MKSAARAAMALFPLALVPVLVHLIGSGRLDLGGGEKDMVWILPWLLWSLLFAVASFVLWSRGWSASRALLRSSIIAFLGVFLTALLLAAIGQLGVGGRF